MAGVQGFEPQQPAPEAGVLPLYDTPTMLVPMKRFELLRGHPHYALNVARLPVPPHRLILLPLLNLHDSRGVCQMKFDVGAINPRRRFNAWCIDVLVRRGQLPLRRGNPTPRPPRPPRPLREP